MGLIFVFIGVLLIFGIFTGDTILNAFVNLINYWPIILIFVGLSILSGVKGLKWLRYLNAVLTVCFIVYIFFWPSAFLSGSRAVSDSVVLESADQPRTVEIKLDIAMVNLQIEPMSGTVPLSTVAQVDYTVRGSRLKVESSSSSDVARYWLGPDSNVSWLGSSTMIIKLNPAYNYTLRINSAAVNGKFELIELKIDRLELNCAVAKVDFKIPEVSNSNIKVNAAIINGDIFLPDNVKAILRGNAAIKNIKSKLTDTGSGSDSKVFEGSRVDYTSDLSFESAIMNLEVLR